MVSNNYVTWKSKIRDSLVMMRVNWKKFNKTSKFIQEDRETLEQFYDLYRQILGTRQSTELSTFVRYRSPCWLKQGIAVVKDTEVKTNLQRSLMYVGEFQESENMVSCSNWYKIPVVKVFQNTRRMDRPHQTTLLGP